MDRNDFIAANPIEAVLESRGVRLIGGGNNPKAVCPFHEDKNPSLSVDIAKGLWNCHAGCGGGSVIDLIARFENTSAVSVLSEASKRAGMTFPAKRTASQEIAEPKKQTIEKVYQYKDALGRDVYQVVRMVPKTFRQRHAVGDKWVWNMEGVERVLYRLPEVLQTEEIVVVEGEKDADNLSSLGFCATCNVGGAGKWLDGYTESLVGKRVVLCGDNDEPGRKHMELVFESLAGKAAEVRVVSLPKEFKDVSHWISGRPDADVQFRAMIASATAFIKGIKLPIYHFAELQDRYSEYAQKIDGEGMHLGSWLPGLATTTRPLVPGELVMILGATGVGKTAILSNIAMAAKNLRTLFFELELPEELLFERLLAMRSRMPCDAIEAGYKTGEKESQEFMRNLFPNLFICTQSRLMVSDIENYVNKSELKMGSKPQLVLLDYIGLVRGIGKDRYDRVSQIAEDLKVMAKATNTIVICATQVSRKGADDSPEVRLTDAKDSGSIENSAGIVLGAWRDAEDSGTMHLKILKNTKGRSGDIVSCRYDGPTMRITQHGSK